MKNRILICIMLLIAAITACKKTEENIIQDIANKDAGISINHSSARVGKGIDSTEYYMNMDKPTRDAICILKSGGRLPVTKFYRDFRSIRSNNVIGNGYFPYACNNDLIVLGYPGAVCPGGGSNGRTSSVGSSLDCPTYINDIWNNKIYALGTYGNDDRNVYYVYLPTNFNANSKIAVLIHGGGWITGPDPNQVNGWGSALAPDVYPNTTNKQANNLVKNLLIQGYVVVAPLYRLVAYGDTIPDILATPTTINDQIDDIDAAILHVKANFPTCLGINANNIQVLGESAGAHLALLYAYTRANTAYVKSVVSIAGPTNMNQMANFVKSKNLIHFLINQGCGKPFVIDNYNNTTLTHMPFYTTFDPSVDFSNMLITNVTNFSNMNCTITSINLPWYVQISNSSTIPPISTTIRRGDSYKLAQSCVRQIISTPLTAPAFTAISPRFQLNNSRIIPTFIIHGTKDRVVPYSQATDGMETALTNIGGLIGIYTNPTYAPTTYTTGMSHLVKKYTNADHNVADFQDPSYPANMGPSQTQIDVLNWFNGH